MALLSILISVALGCLLVYRFAGLNAIQPRWSVWLIVFGSGAAAGIGVAACLFFILLPVGIPRLSLLIRVLLLCGVAFDLLRNRRPTEKPGPSPRPSYTPLLWAAFALALVIVTYGMSTAWQATPNGNWDAWSIWNLRAKFLAAGDGLATRAWSPQLNFTHPEYPLLLSSFVAASWADAGAVSETAPIAASYLFFLGLVALVTGGIAALRGAIPGLLAGLCLLGIPAVLTEVPAQYSDIPLACFFAAALIFTILDRPVFAGLFAGFAAWTKNEGLLFLVVLLIAIAILMRPKLLRFCGGALPATALALIFKLVIAAGTREVLGGSQAGAVSKLTDFSRYRLTASAMIGEPFHWNIGWYHPILPLVALAIALGFDLRQKRDAIFSIAVPAALLLGYFAVYIATPYELAWQLQSSLTRLYVQAAPLLLLAFFVALRSPQFVTAVEAAKPAAAPRRKSKR